MTALMYSMLDDAGTAYPLDDFPPPVKRALIGALHLACRNTVERIRQHGTGSENEPTINTVVEEELNRILDSGGHGGFRRDTFCYVARDPSVLSHNGSHIEKKPDLIVRLQDGATHLHHRHRFVVIECKIIDKTHPVRLYCENGIRRFVDGEYGWSMPTAMLLAYTADDCSLPDTLSNELDRRKTRKQGDDCNTVQNPAINSELPEDTYDSRHSRRFTFPNSGAGAGTITLHHIWFELGGASSAA